MAETEEDSQGEKKLKMILGRKKENWLIKTAIHRTRVS